MVFKKKKHPYTTQFFGFPRCSGCFHAHNTGEVSKAGYFKIRGIERNRISWW